MSINSDRVLFAIKPHLLDFPPSICMQVHRVYVASPPGINQQHLVQHTVCVLPGVAKLVPKPD
eukprot:5353663-Pyramimonas_sp.AAC.1